MKFGDNLKKLRKSKKLSQEDLAEKMRVSRQSVSKWETGEAYPEMNNILELCKIFHCCINDLVNDKIIDKEGLDEETKNNVVKLQKEEQQKIKGLSKTIAIASKIGNIFCKIALLFIVLIMIVTPLFFHNVEVKENKLVWNNDKLKIINDRDKFTLKYNENVILIGKNSKMMDALNHNSKYFIVGYIEIGFLTLCITLFLTLRIFSTLEKLFINIHQGDTPFTLENTNFIRKIACFMIVATLLSNISGVIVSKLLNTDSISGWELFDLIQILFLFSMIYIFKYGYQLQLESSGIMYTSKKE